MSSFNCLDCHTSIPGTDCAYTLSRAKNWKNKPGCYAHCKCGYPVRAPELRAHVFSGLLNSGDEAKKSKVNAYIYVSGSGGNHVYYGTYDNCVTGNGMAASGMSDSSTFERYGSAN